MKYIMPVLTCTLMLHSFANSASAGTPVIWNTRSLTTISGSSHPATHGMNLVWQAKGGLAGTTSSQSDWEIFYYDLDLETVMQLTDDAFDDTLPRTDGTSIVWQKYVAGAGSQIFLYQLNGSTPSGGTRISITGNSDQFSPDIAEGLVVWSRQQIQQSYNPREILLYNAQTHTGPEVISNSSYNCSSPRIADKRILYQQDNPDGTETFFLYDANDDNPEAKPVPVNFTWYANPQIDGEQTVISRYSGTDREIFLHTRTGEYTKITENDRTDINPVISQNHIAWIADGDIYLTDIATLMSVSAADVSSRWPTGFVVSWSELSEGANTTYLLDVSTDAEFKNFVNGYHALNVGEVTQYTVNGLIPGRTYYYRINAIVNGSAKSTTSVTAETKRAQSFLSL